MVVACFFWVSYTCKISLSWSLLFDGSFYNLSYLSLKKKRPWICLVGYPQLILSFLFNILNEHDQFVHGVWILLFILFWSIRLRRTSANLPRRVWHLPKLVLYFVIPMVLLRSGVSQGARSCGFSRLMVCLLWFSIGANLPFYSGVIQLISCCKIGQVLLLRFLRISITSSRKQWLSASIWRGTGRIRIPSLDWSWLRVGSIVLLAITRGQRSCHLSGSSKSSFLRDSILSYKKVFNCCCSLICQSPGGCH